MTHTDKLKALLLKELICLINLIEFKKSLPILAKKIYFLYN